MAAAVLATGVLRAALPAEIRTGDSRWLFIVVVVVLLAVLVIGDPGRIDRDSTWLRVMTISTIGVISVANATAAGRLVAGILGGASFTNDANVLLASGGAVWLTNVIAFGLWYWDLDRGGAAARARGTGLPPAFVFPEMTNAQYVEADWYPKFMDYLHVVVQHGYGIRPDGRLGDQAVGQAHDGGRIGDLTGGRAPGRRSRRQHLEVALRITARSCPVAGTQVRTGPVRRHCGRFGHSGQVGRRSGHTRNRPRATTVMSATAPGIASSAKASVTTRRPPARS